MVMKVMIVKGFDWFGYATLAKRVKAFHEIFTTRDAKFGVGAPERVACSGNGVELRRKRIYRTAGGKWAAGVRGDLRIKVKKAI